MPPAIFFFTLAVGAAIFSLVALGTIPVARPAALAPRSLVQGEGAEHVADDHDGLRPDHDAGGAA